MATAPVSWSREDRGREWRPRCARGRTSDDLDLGTGAAKARGRPIARATTRVASSAEAGSPETDATAEETEKAFPGTNDASTEGLGSGMASRLTLSGARGWFDRTGQPSRTVAPRKNQPTPMRSCFMSRGATSSDGAAPGCSTHRRDRMSNPGSTPRYSARGAKEMPMPARGGASFARSCPRSDRRV